MCCHLIGHLIGQRLRREALEQEGARGKAAALEVVLDALAEIPTDCRM